MRILAIFLAFLVVSQALPVEKVPERPELETELAELLQGLPEEVIENGKTLRENSPDHPVWKLLDEYLEYASQEDEHALSDEDFRFSSAEDGVTNFHHGRCNAVAGTCIDLNAYICGGDNSKIIINKCPGGNNIRCCPDAQKITPRPCNDDPRFACVDRNREPCANYITKKCPGPSTTNCCLDKKIQTTPVVPPKPQPRIVTMGFPPGCTVPDVPFIVSSAHRQLVLNTKINRGYAQFAHCYQRIAGPSAPLTGSGARTPVWFAIAPYASRNVGKGEAAVLGALAALSSVGASPWAMATAAALLYDAIRNGLGGATVCNTPTVTKRLLTLMIRIGAKNTANTLVSALEHGNRLIFADVGLFGQRYLEWRAAQDSATFSPDKVVSDFSRVMGANAVSTRALFDTGKTTTTATDDFSHVSNTMDLMVAAAALYELAGSTAGTSAANRLIKEANNMMAWREQAVSVPPAFISTPDRTELFNAITPTFTLTFRTFEWTYCEFCKRTGLDATTTNWGFFSHRWPPILDSFTQAYKKSGEIFPMPASPDATVPM